MSLRERRRKTRLRARVSVASVTAGTALAGAHVAEAATFTVDNLNDAGPGSLRQAVSQANAAQDPDQIVFQSGLSGQIGLAAQIPITAPVAITGPGAGTISVSGNDATRIFEVLAGAGESVSVSGLTLTDGNSPSGGAILHRGGRLTVSGAVIEGSRATTGGGVLFDPSMVSGSTLTVEHSTVSGNTATGNGGGLAGRLDVYANPDDESANGLIVVRDSTISGNSAGGRGGGISAEASAMGSSDYCAGYYGPYMYYCPNYAIASLDLEARRTTVAGNSAGAAGGGGIHVAEASLLNGNASADAIVANTIVADNAAGASANDTDTSGPGRIVADFSLVESDAAPIVPATAGSNIIGQDPQLGPLAMNGGPTPTRAIPKSSPALDKGRGYGATTDQRGSPREADFADVPNSAPRPWDGTDIGAFELQFPPPPPIPAECNSTEVTKDGTAGPDVINGTAGRDVIAGHGGNDLIRGLGGNDLLCGDAGRDRILGGAGRDVFFGGSGGDVIGGGGGRDFLLGEGGADRLSGDAGPDTLLGGGSADRLSGGRGPDELKGGGGKDRLTGGGGKDIQKQ